jgi:hypothetical protein
MHRWVFCAIIVASLLMAPAPVAADEALPLNAPGDQRDLCTKSYQLSHLGECPLEGPGGNAEQRQRFELPADLPLLKVLPFEPITPTLTRVYAKVVTADAPVFASPEEGIAGVVKRTIRKGFIYVSYGKPVTVNGQEFIRINADEYMRSGDLASVAPSRFHGIELAEQPRRPFAWVVRKFTPRPMPDAKAINGTPPLNRYEVVQIYAKTHAGQYDWYLVGPNQWVEQRNLSIVEVIPPPEGVSGKWIAVNLFEQTMAIYEGQRMIYASLVSSGLGAWPTRPGTFQIYSKLPETKMSGAYARDKSDFYYLEDVPWTMYFDQSIALHGAYWHDGYGFRKSHGCVNLSPADSVWLYNWAEIGTTVYVYDPSGETPTDLPAGGGP